MIHLVYFHLFIILQDADAIENFQEIDRFIPKELQRVRLGFIANPTGERAKYYMSIMKEAHIKMRQPGESDKSFKANFVAERSRQFDVMQLEKASFEKADGCKERASVFLDADYQLKLSDGRRLNHCIEEHKAAQEKLHSLQQTLKDHDATLWSTNGRNLIQGNEFQHHFNDLHLSIITTKCLQVDKDLNALEELLTEFGKVFKGVHLKSKSKQRKRKENARKSVIRKNKRFTKNVQRVYETCVKSPFDDDETPATFLSFPPCVIIPKEFIDMESVSNLNLRDAPQIAHLLKVTPLSNGAASRVLDSLNKNVQDKVFEILYPEDDTSKEDDELSEPAGDELDDDSLSSEAEEDSDEDDMQSMIE